jgi:hypothetical protein
MFFTGETLKCTGCSQSFSFPLGDHCVYTTGDLNLSAANLWSSPHFHRMLRRRAWCVQCNGPVLVERVPTVNEFMQAAALMRSPADNRPAINDELLELTLDEQRFLFGKLAHRTAGARCLCCSSLEWISIEVVDGKLSPPLLHEACNSPLEWSGFIASYVRRAGFTKVRAYSFDGELLASSVV